MSSDDQQREGGEHDDPAAPSGPVGGPLAGVLADPATWAELDPALEDRIVGAIAAEANEPAEGPDPAEEPTVAVTSIDRAPSRRRAVGRWVGPIVAGIAAAIGVLVGVAALTRDAGNVDIEVAMVGTDLAPDAQADLGIEATPDGTRLVLDVSGLAPAPEGTVYEAWLRKDAEVGVSAGTFHLRGGGDGELELWAGVSVEDYPLVTVTLQDEADPVSSGQVVLRALVE